MITILTPAYNRGYILHEAFQSLCAQTNFDFEWIVVDDGSLDNTQELVQEWMEQGTPFPLIYFKQENGGKHRAINRGVKLSTCEYLLILDSDDFLEPDAVEWIHQWIATIDGKDGFAGVAGLRGWKEKNEPIGSFMESDFIDATNLERKKLCLDGDKAEVYKTEILRKYPFPEFEGENFLRESAVWDAIARDGYQMRWFNKIIYRCEYLEDGLTQGTDTAVYLKNFQGFTYCMKMQAQIAPFPYRYLKIGSFANVAKEKGLSTKEARRLLEVSILDFLLGKSLYFLRDCIKNIKK